MIGRVLVIVMTISVILAAGWFTMRRPDISYATLESVYGNADSRFLKSTETGQIHFRDVGPRDAPVIVLVHGYSASLHTWESWVSNLRRDYRVISLDLPGHGLSGCSEFEDIGIAQFTTAIDHLADTLGVDKFTLVGSSMGGHAAWAYALAHPEKLDALVLVDAAGWLDEPGENANEPLIFKLLRNPLARTLIRDLDMKSLIRSGLEKSFVDATLVTDEMVDRYAALARAPCHRDALLNLASTIPDVLASDELLAGITAPTLIMHGDGDNLVPLAHGRKFAAAIPGSVLKIYPDTGHIPQEEVPAESVQDLRAFLSGLSEQTVVEEAEVTSGE